MSPVDTSVSPGLGGFLAFFLLACALWLLMRSMIRHLRGVDHREQIEEKQRLAEQEADVATRPSGLAARPNGARSPDDATHVKEPDPPR